MTVAELQAEIIRLKKKKTSVFWHMPIRDMRFWRLRIIQEILTD